MFRILTETEQYHVDANDASLTVQRVPLAPFLDLSHRRHQDIDLHAEWEEVAHTTQDHQHARGEVDYATVIPLALIVRAGRLQAASY